MPKLYVIAGHGAGDPGACAHGFKEATQVRKLAKRIKDLGGSAVTVHDMSQNVFASGAMSRINVGRDTAVLELHMDSAGPGARGAHVIIKSGFKADAFDEALAAKVCAMFPGRSNRIVGRDNLKNCNVAARRGINYRLMETGFISDQRDATYFDSHIDDIAIAVLEAAGIRQVGGKGEEPVYAFPKIQKGSKGDATAMLQSALNIRNGAGLKVDHDFGANTEKALRAWQTKKGIGVDGVCGPTTWGTLLRP